MDTIEIFKTNVTKESQGRMIQDLIQRNFKGFVATFDLEDCDKVLRVKSSDRAICADSLITLLADFGYRAEVMNDDRPAVPLFLMNSVSAPTRKWLPA